ncbi:hypothetical protein [Sulfurospirillum sp. 1612]|uniref:hypothetical protein n=1 Tax=Sulfurospirillum sp. 1612 TaxID=3094835 RepID=UPI002F926E41
MMHLKKFLILLGLSVALFFSGCATTFSGAYSQKVDPNEVINPHDTILVTTNKDDIASKYYVDDVIYHLNKRGFDMVYSYTDANIPPVKYKMVIRVYKKTTSYKYNSADYGPISTGTVRTNCYKEGKVTRCVTTPNQTYGIIGYSQKIRYLHGHYFIMTVYNTQTQEKVFVAKSSTFETSCDNMTLYRFLIDETIKRMNFHRPMEYKFSVKMPDGFTCQ